MVVRRLIIRPDGGFAVIVNQQDDGFREGRIGGVARVTRSLPNRQIFSALGLRGRMRAASRTPAATRGAIPKSAEHT